MFLIITLTIYNIYHIAFYLYNYASKSIIIFLMFLFSIMYYHNYVVLALMLVTKCKHVFVNFFLGTYHKYELTTAGRGFVGWNFVGVKRKH